jgi:tRNA A-37 threonylcarbamoyl transferase component Bud32
LHFVNWQRDISIETVNGKKVIVKKNKASKGFHEYLLVVAYGLISILMMHPSPPPSLGEITRKNEGFSMRSILRYIGVPTPNLLSISDTIIIEEYISGGNLYQAFSQGRDIKLSYCAGVLTGKLHNAGYSFVDNKCQNYLIDHLQSIIRTDLGFTQKNTSAFSRGMDIGTFLASVIDLEQNTYLKIENLFLQGYESESKDPIPFFWLILRNLLSLGFASNRILMVRNMLQQSF